MADVDKVMRQLDEAMHAAGFEVDSMSLLDKVCRTYHTEAGVDLSVDVDRRDPDSWLVRLHLPGRMYAKTRGEVDVSGLTDERAVQKVLAGTVWRTMPAAVAHA